MTLSSICLDNYEGIVMKRDSAQLDGVIFRGLKTCTGIIVASEHYLLAIHHPAFELSNSFSAIQAWTSREDFGVVSDLIICANRQFPRARDMHPVAFGMRIASAIGFEGEVKTHVESDDSGIFRVHKTNLEIELLTVSTLNEMAAAKLLLNGEKTVASRYHYLIARLAYHGGERALCSINIMTRRQFLEMPLESIWHDAIALHVQRLRENTAEAVGALAQEICQAPLWVTVLDLDIYASKAEHAKGLVGKLQRYFLFLEQLAAFPNRRKQAECRQAIINFSKQGDHFVALVAPTEDTSTLLSWLTTDNTKEPEIRSQHECKMR
ncbi:MAG: hypothetical protein K0U37_07180 [Gammaproteobacteria bacterium]|nr:hypothetical protein [Gammaproteobacteria bacterium]